jgi:hypothetical protein
LNARGIAKSVGTNSRFCWAAAKPVVQLHPAAAKYFAAYRARVRVEVIACVFLTAITRFFRVNGLAGDGALPHAGAAVFACK